MTATETAEYIPDSSLQVNECLHPAFLDEQKTILYLSYLTTLGRLPENRDLDELFDGDIQLGEEEMFAIYGLIEVLNGSNGFFLYGQSSKIYGFGMTNLVTRPPTRLGL